LGNCDYALKKCGWDESYHWGHNDAKGRVGGSSIPIVKGPLDGNVDRYSPDFILSQGQEGITSTLLTVGPYMEMLFDGMFVPVQEGDGTLVRANPAGQ